MRAVLTGLALLVQAFSAGASASASGGGPATVMLVIGAPGGEEYEKQFTDLARLWETNCQKGGLKLVVIGLSTNGEPKDLERLKMALEDESRELTSELWLVFIGHGTFDGRTARFNLRGPDVSAAEVAAWLLPFRRPVAVVNCASASGPFINVLSAPGRVVVAATRSGYEQNYARFSQYFSRVIADPNADLDKDGQTSLLEAFLMASRQVAEFYENEGRLATEHALLDDNGDSLGTPADWFRGIRAVRKAREGASLDGVRAHQFHLIRSEAERSMPAAVRARRDELELAIARLRDSKSQLAEDEYYRRLENLLIELGKLYQDQAPGR